MKEFAAIKGGRRLCLEDLEYLQQHSSAWGELFKTYGNFVASGCNGLYVVESNTVSFTSGYIFIDGKLCQFAGGSLVGTVGYFKLTTSSENSYYADGSTAKGRNIYTATLSSTVVDGDKYVKYCVVKDFASRIYQVSYDTFTSVVCKLGEYVKTTPAREDLPVIINGMLEMDELLFSNTDSRIMADGTSLILCPGYNPLAESQTSLVVGDGKVTVTKPSNEDATELEVKTVTCDAIKPKTAGNSLNVIAKVLTNGKELMTIESARDEFMAIGDYDPTTLAMHDQITNIDATVIPGLNICIVNGFFNPTYGFTVGGKFNVQPRDLESITPANPDSVYFPVYNLDDMAVVGYGQVRNDAISITFTSQNSSAKGYSFSTTYILKPENEASLQSNSTGYFTPTVDETDDGDGEEEGGTGTDTTE